MKNALVIVSTLVSMVVLAAAAAGSTLYALMLLGLKFHNNYEYYGQSSTAYLIPIAGVIGFALPGIIAWKLSSTCKQVSLRTLFALTALVALLCGAIVLAIRLFAG